MKNIALIGCGRISKNHLESIAQLSDDLKLVAVCDLIEERARAAGEKYGAAWYTDYDKMLERQDIDVIAVCTPSGLHPEHGIKAARKGINVISEKPMAISLPQR
jgi:UDP-N-acetyl-2-amino-2-deoxyglucuronate dehydrogenase